MAGNPADLRVRDVMTAAPLTVDAGDRVATALELMRSRGIRHLPVMQGDALVGILTDRDLRWLFGQHLDAQDGEHQVLEDDLVGEVMTSNPLTVADDASVLVAVDLLLQHRIGGLPVVDADSGRLVGICTYVDLLHAFRGMLTRAV